MQASGRASSRNNRRKGFTLIELTIVLAVIGVAVGALFAATGTVLYRNRINQASDQLVLTADNIKTLYMGRNISFAALDNTPSNPRALGPIPLVADFTFYTPRMRDAGVFPVEMIQGGVAINPWNGLVQIALVGVGAGNPVRFVVRYTNLDFEVCTDMLLRNSLPGRETALTAISINGNPAIAGNNLPLDTVRASVACGVGANNQIDWYYSLGT